MSPAALTRLPTYYESNELYETLHGSQESYYHGLSGLKSCRRYCYETSRGEAVGRLNLCLALLSRPYLETTSFIEEIFARLEWGSSTAKGSGFGVSLISQHARAAR